MDTRAKWAALACLLLIITLAAPWTPAGPGDVMAQTSRVAPGVVSAGGGASSSSGFRLVASVGAPPLGISSSGTSVVRAGLIASLGSDIGFNVNPLGATPPSGAPIQITATVENGAGVTVELFHRQGGESGWDNPAVMLTTANNTTFTGAIPASSVGIRGVEYYLVASGPGGSISQPPGDAPNNPFIAQTRMTNFPAVAMPDAQYLMIGFPFDVSPSSVAAVFEDDLGVANNTLWKLGRWDQTLNGGTGGYREYSEVGAIARGNGYWLIARGTPTIDASGLSAQPDDEIAGIRYATLNLSPGWNQITTPFAFTIDWNERIEEVPADIEDALHAFVPSTGTYQTTNVMTTFTGYWVNNVGAATRTVKLPYVELPAVGIAQEKAVPTPSRWELPLRFVSGSLVDESVVIGARADASSSYDERDFGHPPSPQGSYIAASSIVRDERRGELQLAGDYRAPVAVGEGWRYELQMRGELEPGSSGIATIAASDRGSLPEDFTVALLIAGETRAYELPASGAMTLPHRVSSVGTRYELLVGPREWIERASKLSTLPQRVTLRQNYPNPFNPMTTIEFGMPTPGHASLAIYNIAGQRVATLVDGEMPAGLHSIPWNGIDARGRGVASGQYFYRLQVGEVVTGRRMLLVR